MLNSDLTEWERKEIQKNISSIKGNLEEELKNLIEKMMK
jgi:flagellar hook-associated protein FlgK